MAKVQLEEDFRKNNTKLRFVLFFRMLLPTLLLTSCIGAKAGLEVLAQPVASLTPVEPLAEVPVTAKPDEVLITALPATPGPPPATTVPETLWVPLVSPQERPATSDTWLYITAFQYNHISVVDPASGHALYEMPVVGDSPGLAVSPDGQRIYVVDGEAEGRVRVIDTAAWEVIHQETIQDRALLLGGNPISLSGDGHWLLVDHYSYAQETGWVSIFDTQALKFLSSGALRFSECPRPIHLVGHPDHERLYLDCGGFVVALDSASLESVWMADAPNEGIPALALAPDGERLYGLYPRVVFEYSSDDGHGRVTATELRVLAWETATGNLDRNIELSDQIFVPPATIGRGDAAYLAISPDGERLRVAWEDRLWTLSPASLQVTGELKLPAPVDGMALSSDGREVYLLPAFSGDLVVRETGLWTVDAAALTLIRHASDWPLLTVPVMLATPAPEG